MLPLPPADLDHVIEHAGEALGALAGARVFITGGTGFVGTWLVESLLHANDRLGLGASAVILTREPERFQRTHAHLRDHPALAVLAGDLASFAFPTGTFPAMIHAATPAANLDIDAQCTARVVEFARTHGVRRLLFTSSGAVYGRQPAEMTHVPEDFPGAEPFTTYGQAKRAVERQLTAAALEHGFDALIARLFAFTGPRLPLDANFAAGNFVRDALAGGPIRISGDGTPYRSYLYAADLAVWLWTILSRGQSGRAYNVGSGEAVTIKELACIIAALPSPATRVEPSQAPPAGTSRYVPCVHRAERELQLRPLIGLQAGLQRMCDWAKSQPPG